MRIAASSTVLPAIGFGFLAEHEVMRWLLPVLLIIGVAGLWIPALRRGRRLVAGLGVFGASVLYGGWFFSVDAVLYSGMGLLMGASLLNLWQGRRVVEEAPLVQIGKVNHGKA